MREYQICTRCVMDTTALFLSFDAQGVCQYCNRLDMFYKNNMTKTQDQIDAGLKNVAGLIKRRARNAKYDCILGLSGGVDSSFVAHLLVEKMGLNPLIIHFDNGWNSIIAVENIQNIVSKLNLDMMTYVINWEEFKDLQRSFLKASVLDIEMLTDNAIYGATVKIAKEKGICCIISGGNYATESGLPDEWRWEKIDVKNIKAIHHIFGKVKLKTFPFYGLFKIIFDKVLNKIYHVYPLDIIKYNKTEAMALLKEKYGWRYYGGKHYESFFTKFYQAYILPRKFGIDKRRAHLSSLIRNQEITRDQALVELEKPLYNFSELVRDKEYVLKKLDFSEDEFAMIMGDSIKKHTDYSSDLKWLNRIKKLVYFLKIKKSPVQ